MLILGATTDDTGTQLEHLTHNILNHLGYKSIKNNFIGAGGQELDVSAEYPINLPGVTDFRRTLCECKAYRTQVGMDDWLKFLGKIYAEEIRLGAEVQGVFIALNGVNGNVAGNYDELKQHGSKVLLFSGDGIAAELRNLYSFAPANKAATALRTYSSKQYLTIDLAYYQKRLYWVFTFDNGSFCVLDGDGDILRKDDHEKIGSLVKDRLKAKTCIDLSAEAEAKEKGLQVCKFVLASAIANGGDAVLTNLSINIFGYSDPELREAIGTLQAGDLGITGTLDGIHLPSKSGAEFSTLFGRIIKLMLSGYLHSEVFDLAVGSEFYDSNINDGLLVEISRIQQGLKFSEESIQKILKLLTLSPSALLYALSPDPMIVTHRIQQPEVGRNMDSEDEKTFLRTLCERFRIDFEKQYFIHYFYEKRKLRECDIVEVLRIKNQEKTILEQQNRKRRIIAPASRELGGGHLAVQGLESAPEPWEMSTTHGQDKKGV